MPDIYQEPPLRIEAVSERYDIKMPTIRGWILHGCKTAWGRVYLEAYKMGDRWFTSERALAAFRAACNGPPRPPPQKPDRDLSEAQALLERLGVE